MDAEKLNDLLNQWQQQAGCPITGDRVDAFRNGAMSFANFILQSVEQKAEEAQ